MKKLGKRGTRVVCKITRELARTGVGPGKTWYGTPGADQLETRQWGETQGKTGQEGGRNGREGKPQDEWGPQAVRDFPALDARARAFMKGIGKEVAKFAFWKSTPEWSMPVEIVMPCASLNTRRFD